MTLPVPNLDDRRFQDLVDDAKRLVMRRCPEWTDHNVSDPGVTLIETFAFMTDQLLYRLNQVPDRLYVTFLDLIGLRLFPPVPATVPVTFWLSAPAVSPLTIGAGTSAATVRTESADSVVFATLDDLAVVPCTLSAVRTEPAAPPDADGADGADADQRQPAEPGADPLAAAVPAEPDEPADRTDALALGAAFAAFSAVPRPGAARDLGRWDAVPRCAVRVDFRGRIEGVGVDPRDPPLAWECWTANGWAACDVDTDETGGLNRPGVITVHVPPEHVVSLRQGTRAGWLRVRVTESGPEQTRYSSSPVVHGLSACTVGGTTTALHAEVVRDEVLGFAEGVAGQQFALGRAPVLRGAGGARLAIGAADGWQDDWTEVTHFAASGPDDRHFLLDAVTGTVRFGPALREADGSLRQHGAVPAKGAVVRMVRYTVGGGAGGNVTAGAISTLKSAIPFVAGVGNRSPARGGVDGESLAEAIRRAPVLLRTRGRAVTAEDYEAISQEAAPELARIRCVPAAADEASGAVRVLIVPRPTVNGGRIAFHDLVPADETLRKVADRLDAVRLVGARVVVEPPLYRGVTVVARLTARPGADVGRVETAATDALFALLDPVTGGPDGGGWAFGRPVQVGEIFAALQAVAGVDLVTDVRLFGANPVTGERGKATDRLDLPPNALVFSYGHQVRAERS
jgi:predicted phage baseplate assembly protein